MKMSDLHPRYLTETRAPPAMWLPSSRLPFFGNPPKLHSHAGDSGYPALVLFPHQSSPSLSTSASRGFFLVGRSHGRHMLSGRTGKQKCETRHQPWLLSRSIIALPDGLLGRGRSHGHRFIDRQGRPSSTRRYLTLRNNAHRFLTAS